MTWQTQYRIVFPLPRVGHWLGPFMGWVGLGWVGSFRDLVLMLQIYVGTVSQNRTDTVTDSCLMVK